jgi:hypothetical protein
MGTVRRRHGEERVATVVARKADALGHSQADLAGRGGPPQHDVTVEARRLGQARARRFVIRDRDLDRVAGRGDARRALQAIADHRFDGEPCGDRAVAVTIGIEALGVRDPARSTVIADVGDRGEVELPPRRIRLVARDEEQRLDHADLDADRSTRWHVAEPLLERVGAILLEQAGGLALEQGVAIPLLGTLAPLDLAADQAIADPDVVPEHRAVGGQRQDVEHLERFGVPVRELLGQRGEGDAAFGLRADAGGDERVAAAVDADQPRRAFRLDRFELLRCHDVPPPRRRTPEPRAPVR